MIDGMAEARVSFHIGATARARARARGRARARAMARDRARARARVRDSARGMARTSLELGLGLVRVSCIIKKLFKWLGKANENTELNGNIIL